MYQSWLSNLDGVEPRDSARHQQTLRSYVSYFYLLYPIEVSSILCLVFYSISYRCHRQAAAVLSFPAGSKTTKVEIKTKRKLRVINLLGVGFAVWA